jgi:hypothetical protein
MGALVFLAIVAAGLYLAYKHGVLTKVLGLFGWDQTPPPSGPTGPTGPSK